ncbi:MAG: RNA polymerase sigma factor [Phycisphaerales bacterium]
MENDLKDVLASAAGDGEAYRRVVKTYEQQIGRLMWRFTRDKGECETLVQDVFVEAFFSLKSYKGKGPFSHWLNKIATRVGYRFWKQQERARIVIAVEDFEGIDVGDSQQDQIDPTEAAAALHKLLAKMQTEDRLVLTLMYFEDCSIEEIARRVGWTRAGTKMRAMRARGKLKKIAEKEKFSERFEWIK